MLADLKLAVSAGAEGLQLGVLKGVAAQEYSRDGQQPERQLVQQRHDHSVMI
jgi:hypothetical protein